MQVDAVAMPRSADNPHGNGFTAEVGNSEQPYNPDKDSTSIIRQPAGP
jgi:hypothetical protein